MEQHIIFKQAKKIINILYIYELYHEYRSGISVATVVEGIADIFFIYDKDGNIINIDDDKKVESKDLLLPIKDRCMQHNDCQQCEIDDIVRAVHSINYTYENHIYNMNSNNYI